MSRAMTAVGMVAVLILALAVPSKAADAGPSIVISSGASKLETLAAREIRRYVYLRTGKLLMIQAAEAIPAGQQFVITRKDRKLVAATGADVKQAADALTPQQYLLKTVGSRVLVIGGNDAGTLYGAYRLAEKLGIAFDLDQDVIPDQQVALEIPNVDEVGKPLFELRGIQPFHDFPEGPDWWDTDHYKAILAQLPKLRMNFFGLHTYPEGGVGPEPTVWIGLPQDLGADGSVQYSYCSTWQNTLRGNWGYQPRRTSEWAFGAWQLFEQDGFGNETMFGYCPRPTDPQGYKEVFDRAGNLLRESFTYAHDLGIKTCVGTETPLIVPQLVKERLKQAGISDEAAMQKLYEGIFLRIARTYPLDYYWFWTPEGWTWDGTSDENVKKAIADLQAAIAAAKEVHAPFSLATCGWVLGPQQDRAMFDKILPKKMPISCINRQVGKDPVEPGFAKVQGRGKWAIPWMEDDPNLLMPQLWVGRMRKDAADALKYGCDGLFGIHWRTRIISPNAIALAKAAWDQSGWNKPEAQPAVVELPKEGAIGGQFAAFPNNPIVSTDEPAIYQTVRYNVDAYHLAVPDGRYTVTLKFCEPHYREVNKRVFGVKLQGQQVIEHLDIFAKAGQNKALDYTFKDVQTQNGSIDIEFTREVEYPSIAGITVEGNGVTRKINCGGGADGAYAADWPASNAPNGPRPDRYLPTSDFYREWATAQFGPEAANDIAKVFAKIDGYLPEVSSWTDGPGGLVPNAQAWPNASKLFAYVDELAGLRPRIQGAGNLQRFDYWLNNFRYMKTSEQVKFVAAQFGEAMKKVAAEKDVKAKANLAEKTALPLRKQLVAAVKEAYGYLLATVNTPGELGTVANWEQHTLPGLIIKPGEELARAIGHELPAEAQLESAYAGAMRVIVPTARPSVRAGETLALKVRVLSAHSVREAAVYWRNLGQGAYTRVPLTHVVRGVYKATIPAAASGVDAIEYYVEATSEAGDTAVFPATAKKLNQTVVVMP
ncbi:MAG: malectin domain-containing carbohydrate-binding protein [Bacillota bacterium]